MRVTSASLVAVFHVAAITLALQHPAVSVQKSHVVPLIIRFMPSPSEPDVRPVQPAKTHSPRPASQPQVKEKPAAMTHAETAPSPMVATPMAQAAAAEPSPARDAGARIKPALAEVLPITPPSFDAGYLQNPAPRYPAVARRMGKEGRVVLRVHVSADGTPDDVQLRSSSGHEPLDAAALGAVKRWRFVPARRGEQAVAAWVLVPITFTLQG